jgi:prepilin-type N-terminal cleavage/methylation domain-containing protein
MTNRVQGRRGFTLGEVLVTVALIAVLAAAVIPSIASQVTKGDLGRIQSDLVSVRGAMEQFLGDVRRYPNSAGQLTNQPTVSQLTLATQAVYTAAEVSRWRGPYIGKDSVSMLATGYAATIDPTFHTMIVGLSGVFQPASPGANDTKWAFVAIPGISQATAQTIDNAMDDGALTTGALRWKAFDNADNAGGAVDTLKFLAMTINK